MFLLQSSTQKEKIPGLETSSCILLKSIQLIS